MGAAKLPPCLIPGICYLLGDPRLALLAHMPNYEMVVRHLDPRMAGVVVKRHMVSFRANGLQVKLLLVRNVVHRNHVDRADKTIFPVVSKKWSRRKRLWLYIQDADAGKKARKIHKRTDLLVACAFHSHAMIRS